ncbi:MAG: glycosyltransferase family 1 protein [Bacteroidota bacterium]
MTDVLVDMHRLRQNPFNGLYTFSYHLGKSLAASPAADMRLHYYLPKEKFGLFGENVAYEAQHSLDKFYKAGTSKFDVWHATTSISWYQPFNKKTRFVFTIHDLNFLIEDSTNSRGNKKLLQRIQRRIDRADHLTFISGYAKDMASQQLNLQGKPATVIYNGCNVNDFPSFDAPRYRPTKPFLFALGLVQPRKNFHLLPALLEGNDYELIIAGLNNYEYKEVVEQEIRRWNVSDRVKLTGAISEEEKYWYYKNCSAFLFPSYAEGFGLPALEAMHFGKPVFLSTETCLPEIGGDAAWYFHSFDPAAMQRVFADGMADFSQGNFQQKIRERAASFSWERAAAQYLEIYSSLA